jgi:DNA repair protein SbcD/Mre11
MVSEMVVGGSVLQAYTSRGQIRIKEASCKTMRILHTADWHLGRTLGGMDLLDAQEYTLESLVRIARQARPDAILIAGDIYDRAIPPERAIALFDDLLIRLRAVAPVLAIAGNHDSGGRLDFGRRLMWDAGVYLSGTCWHAADRVDLQDAHGAVAFHLMPYASPVEVRSQCEGSDIRSHQDATLARIANMDFSGTKRHVLIGHLFVQGGQATEESERDISVGGVASVEGAVFEPFVYTALGHLHRPHQVDSPRIQYSGSIGRYSFSEEEHDKGVNLVEIDAQGNVVVEQIPLDQKYSMRTLRGDFLEIQQNAAKDPHRDSTLIKIVLTDRTIVPNAVHRLRQLYPLLLEFSVERTVEAPTSCNSLQATTPAVTPMEQLERFFLDRFADRLGDEHRELAMQCMEAAMDERQEGQSEARIVA